MDGMPHPDAEALQLRTLLLTDLCDSTSLVEKLGDSGARRSTESHSVRSISSVFRRKSRSACFRSVMSSKTVAKSPLPGDTTEMRKCFCNGGKNTSKAKGSPVSPTCAYFLKKGASFVP